MNDSDLDAEYAALRLEHAELEAEHERLRHNPRDIDAHRTHSARLRAQLERLHAYIEARRSHPPAPSTD